MKSVLLSYLLKLSLLVLVGIGVYKQGPLDQSKDKCSITSANIIMDFMFLRINGPIFSEKGKVMSGFGRVDWSGRPNSVLALN